jgi:hypothetical protein
MFRARSREPADGASGIEQCRDSGRTKWATKRGITWATVCLSCLIQAVRDQVRTVDLKQVNQVLIQPHWRHDCDKPLL